MRAQDILYAIDYDGVLGNSRRTAEVFMSAAAMLDGSLVSRIKLAQKEVEASGGSFDVWNFVTGQIKDKSLLNALETSFKALANTETLLYEDATWFMEQLAQANAKYFILTTGGEKWQRLKLEASGLAHYNYLITSEREKGRLIRAWWHAHEGLYRCPVLSSSSGAGVQLEASRFVLIEDKPMGFEQFPQKHARGYLIHRKGERLRVSQMGAVPKNVRAVQDLQSVLIAEGISSELL